MRRGPFLFQNTWNLFWVYQNGNFLLGKKAFHTWGKNQEISLCPLWKFSSYVPDIPPFMFNKETGKMKIICYWLIPLFLRTEHFYSFIPLYFDLTEKPQLFIYSVMKYTVCCISIHSTGMIMYKFTLTLFCFPIYMYSLTHTVYKKIVSTK